MSCIKKGRSCVSRFKFPKSTTTFYEKYKKNLTKKSYKTQCEKNNQSENSKSNSNIDKNKNNQTKKTNHAFIVKNPTTMLRIVDFVLWIKQKISSKPKC
jgi:hypothetical protein